MKKPKLKIFTIQSEQIKARDYDHAAGIWARRLYGRNATGYRTTGSKGLSGFFQAYKPAPRNERGLAAEGDPFHVWGV